ncbi:hypothetical protein KJS94_02620 [Flavihumibacter rivuli]|uniref:hypothetical protein n=1 Tax=Flavihumibacter rivuli TaxID=2838156 RepID=UPI001BDE6FFE|nr:hypothetical protein [Flavihumibacter rivuli]ULQ57090.1 hypothetical protein KJS94_02620 [Flavihumibacter rivuli]
MENIFWTAYSNKERHAAIEEINQLVKNHGYIVDFKFFSDISLNIRIELEESRIDHLYIELRSIMEMDPFNVLNSSSNRERTVFININFTKGTGNLQIEVPNVPG